MNPLDVLLAIVGAASALYIVANYQELVLRAGMNNETDFVVGVIGTLMVFEAARRVVGWPMITVALFFMIYAFAGPYIPGIMAHRGVQVQELFDHLFFTTEGIFGTPMGVSSTFIYLFILFGSYLEATGLGKFFIDLANAIAGWAAGGPAKVAVLSSGLMGTVSGSSVGNVAGTGAFTIPMMKKLGYRPAFAGAVEAAASTGGQLLPAMFFTMVTSLILGMGVPTTANYVITSTIAAPALVQMNVPVLAAHMFAFYFGIVADVTPPVALAAYAGAGIAGANPMRCGVIAAKLAIAAFIVPYIFVLAPELLMIHATPLTITLSALTAIVGMWGVSVAMIGFCQNLLNLPQRVLFLAGGIGMIIPGHITDVVGVVCLIAAFMWQRTNKIKGAIKQVDDYKS